MLPQLSWLQARRVPICGRWHATICDTGQFNMCGTFKNTMYTVYQRISHGLRPTVTVAWLQVLRQRFPERRWWLPLRPAGKWGCLLVG